MKPVRYAESVELELIDVFTYAEKTWGTEAAKRYLAGLRREAERLGRFPRLGRPWGRTVRRVRYERHVLFYEARLDQVTILAVRHERQVPLRAR